MIYSTISIDDLPKVDFTQVGETSPDTIRKSIDLTQFVLKWNNEPTFIEDETIIPIGIYTHAEILELMSTPAWSEPDPID
jgi:hypothetical protein